jgi:serine/threonine protein kinase
MIKLKSCHIKAGLVCMALRHELKLRYMAKIPLPVDMQQSPAALMADLLGSALVHRESWQRLPVSTRRRLQCCPASDKLLKQLLQCRLLTPFQARRLAIGQSFGLMLGNYRVLDRLGAGATGVVFRGEHRLTRQPVALKVFPNIQEQDQKMLLRLRQEIRTLKKLRHPNIVRFLASGSEHHDEAHGPVLHYLAMELVAGDDLDAMVRRLGPLPIERVQSIARQLASALAEIHRHGLIHRDIKPENVRVALDGSIRLVDFGLAQPAPCPDETSPFPAGTLAYMAPEQIHWPHGVDIRADLYGLGGTLYWCLTGKMPFQPHSSVLEQLAARLRQEAPSPRRLRHAVPRALDAIVRKLLALQPEDRLTSPDELIAALPS